MAKKKISKRIKDNALRRARFVAAYLRHLNATKAAIEAGYSRKTARQQANRLLTNVAIQDEIAQRAQEQLRQAGIDADKVVTELGKLGFSDIRDYLTVDARGVHLKPSDQWSDEAARAVVSVKQRETEDGVQVEVRLHDKKGALDSLARRLGLFKDRLEIAAPDHRQVLEAARAEFGIDHD